MAEPKVIVLLGPTASGKTKLAAHLALLLNGEIVSADSRQLYRDMNIGTGKDLNDYSINGHKINYHLIDIANAGSRLNLNDYLAEARQAISAIINKNKTVIICGGTGLYILALLKGYSHTIIPENDALRKQLNELSKDKLIEKFNELNTGSFSGFDTSTTKRIIRSIEKLAFLHNHPQALVQTPINATVFGLNPTAETRRQMITNRLMERLNNGLINEVEDLLHKGISHEDLTYYGLEYKYIGMYLRYELSYDEFIKQLNTAIHQFAKRQMTFFRKMEKDGVIIHWIPYHLSLDEKIAYCTKKLDS